MFPYVTIAFNTAVQETIGMTPFQLVLGRMVTTLPDAVLPHDPEDEGTGDAQLITQ